MSIKLLETPNVIFECARMITDRADGKSFRDLKEDLRASTRAEAQILDGFFDSILSLKYTVDENRQHRFPTDNAVTEEVVRQNYYELFYPTETEWRTKTIEDFTNAFSGVLGAKIK